MPDPLETKGEDIHCLVEPAYVVSMGSTITASCFKRRFSIVAGLISHLPAYLSPEKPFPEAVLILIARTETYSPEYQNLRPYFPVS